MTLGRNPTRSVSIGGCTIGQGHAIAIQSMTATATRDAQATATQVNDLTEAGAHLVRVAVDNHHDAAALPRIRDLTQGNLAVDLQENYRLAATVAPHVDKIRYNPGHLYHHQRDRPWTDKVKFLAETAAQHDCAIRIGVNCGSVDPEKQADFPAHDSIRPMVHSAWEHCQLLDSIGFDRYCVSLKDSDPERVVELNRAFAAERPEVPLHLGVTEAGIPPKAVHKTRRALLPLLAQGIGDTIRVSLTVPNTQKFQEVIAGRDLLADVAAGRMDTTDQDPRPSLDIISCPSCSRVENEAFVELATPSCGKNGEIVRTY